MTVNRSLSPDARDYLRDCLAVQDALGCPYQSAHWHHRTAKLLTGMNAAHHLHLAILRRRKDQQGFRWVGQGVPS